MQAVKNKWSQHKAYQKLQQIWADYKQISPDKTDELQVKLTEFLEYFQAVHSEHKQVYGDLTEVLSEILAKDQLLVSVAQKALNVTELVLQDESYRKSTPELIEQILAVIDRETSDDARKTALRILVQLGQSSESKAAIGQMEGFKKILDLLIDAKSDLAVEVVKTMQHFLDTKDTEVATAILQVQQKSKVTSLFSDITSIVKSEVGRLLQVGKLSHQVDSVYHQLYPSLLAPGQLDKIIANLQNPSEDVQLKQVSMLNNGLEALVKALHDTFAGGDVKVNVVETLVKLVKSQQLYFKFKECQGYELLFEYVASVTQDDDMFVPQLIDQLCFLLYDHGDILNLDTLNLIVRLSISAESLNMRRATLKCISKLLSGHPKYVAHLHHLGHVEYSVGFMRLMLMEYLSEDDFKQALRLEGYETAAIITYLESLIQFVAQEAVLLQFNDTSVLSQLISLLSACSKLDNPITQKLLQTVLNQIESVLEDCVCRQRTVPKDILPFDWSADMEIVVTYGIWLLKYHKQGSLDTFEPVIKCIMVVGLLVEVTDGDFHVFDKSGGFELVKIVLFTFTRPESKDEKGDVCCDMVVQVVSRIVVKEVGRYISSQDQEFRLMKTQYVTGCIQIPLLLIKEVVAQAGTDPAPDSNVDSMLTLVCLLFDALSDAIQQLQSAEAVQFIQTQLMNLGAIEVLTAFVTTFGQTPYFNDTVTQFMMQMMYGNELVKSAIIERIGYEKLLSWIKGKLEPNWQLALELATQSSYSQSIKSALSSDLNIPLPDSMRDTASVSVPRLTAQQVIEQSIRTQIKLQSQMHLKNPKLMVTVLHSDDELSPWKPGVSQAELSSDPTSPTPRSSRHSRHASYNTELAITQEDDAAQYRHSKSKSNSVSTNGSRGGHQLNFHLTPIDNVSQSKFSRASRQSIQFSVDSQSMIRGATSQGQVSEFSVLSGSAQYTRADDMKYFKANQFLGVIVRDLTAGLFLYHFMCQTREEAENWKMLAVLKLLCQSTPSNKFVLVQAGFATYFIQQYFQQDSSLLVEAQNELLECLAEHSLTYDDSEVIVKKVMSQDSNDPMVAVNLLQQLCKNQTPDHSLYFDGHDSYFESRALQGFPQGRVGYSVAMWVSPFYFESTECGLLTIHDISKSQGIQGTVELSFKKIQFTTVLSTRRSSTIKNTPKVCLMFKVQQVGKTTESFVFDGYDFGSSLSQWLHVSVTQSKDELKLSVNGKQVNVTSSVGYPTWLCQKDKKFIIKLGCRVSLQAPVQVIPLPQPIKNKTWAQSWSQYWYPPNAALTQPASNSQPQVLTQDYFCGQISSFILTDGLFTVQENEQLVDTGYVSQKDYKQFKFTHRLLFDLQPHTLSDVQLSDSLNAYTQRPQSQENTATAIQLVTSTHLKDVNLNLSQSAAPIHSSVMLGQSQSLRLNQSQVFRSSHDKGKFVGQAQILVAQSFPHHFIDCDSPRILLKFMLLGPSQENSVLLLLLVLLKDRAQLQKSLASMDYWHAVYQVLSMSNSQRSVDVYQTLLQLSKETQVRETSLLYSDLALLLKESEQQLALDCFLQDSGNVPSFQQCLMLVQDSKAKASSFKILCQYEPFNISQLQQMINLMCYEQSEDAVCWEVLKLVLARCEVDPALVVQLASLQVMPSILPLLATDSFVYKCSLVRFVKTVLVHPKSYVRNVSTYFDVISHFVTIGGFDKSVIDSLLSIATNSNAFFVDAFRAVLELLSLSQDHQVVKQALNGLLKLLDPCQMDLLWEQAWLDWILPLVQFEEAASLIVKLVVYDLNKKHSMAGKLKGSLHESEIAIRLIVQVTLSYAHSHADSLSLDFIVNLTHLWQYVTESCDAHDSNYVAFVKLVGQVLSEGTVQVKEQVRASGWILMRDNILLQIALIKDNQLVDLIKQDSIVKQCVMNNHQCVAMLLKSMLEGNFSEDLDFLFDLMASSSLTSQEGFTFMQDKVSLVQTFSNGQDSNQRLKVKALVDNQFQVLNSVLMKQQEKLQLKKVKRDKMYKDRLQRQKEQKYKLLSEYIAKCQQASDRRANQHQALVDESQEHRANRQRRCQQAFASLTL